MSTSSELRVFISSTFRDMQEEREHLVKKIFPEIRALCRERGITFTEVDLRWGVTDEQMALGQVIRACLEEVDKCRPYFIGITGDRYGYIPSFLDVQKDPALLQQYPWIEDAAIDGMSLTEMEAHYALLGEEIDKPRCENATFYFRRHRKSLEEVQNNNSELELLESYQGRVRQSEAIVQQFRDPISLGELIYDDLIDIIKRDFADAQPPTPLEEERMRHEAFSLSRRRAYIANPVYLKQLNNHVTSDNPPLVVYAESGSGKSSLFAYWAEQYRRKNPNAHVIEHYVGIGATSTDHFAIIQHICMEIKERFGREEEIPTTPEQLEKAFGQWLGYADHALKDSGEQMVLILDGLNQLQGTALSLKWIPDVISPSIRMILSSTIEGTLVELKRRGWKKLGLQALSEAEREAVVVRYLAEYRKALNPDQIKRIASDYKCGHPLFLKTLLEELRLVNRHEDLERRINEYLESTGTEELFQLVLERMEEDSGTRAVRDVLSLLWCSRSGLDERELSELSGLSRLKIASMVAGLDYHLVRKEGLLTFFHDYLRRAVEKRFLADQTIRNRVHKTLAEYFAQGDLSRRSARELLWQYAQSGDNESLVHTLGQLDILQLLYNGAEKFEVLTEWARLREVGHDPEAVYRESLNQEVDHSEQLKCWSTAADILGLLGMWSGAIDVQHKILVEATTIESLPEIAEAERGLGALLILRGDNKEAQERLEHAVELYEKLDDRKGLSGATGNIGLIYARRGEYDRALEYYQKGLSVAEELGDYSAISFAVGNMGIVHAERGEYDRALECYQQLLAISEELGDRSRILIAIGNIGNVHGYRGEYDDALTCYQQKLTIAKELGDRGGISSAVGNMGVIYAELGEYDRALESYQQGLAIAEELGDRSSISRVIGNIGSIYFEQGEYDRALEHFQQGLTLSEEIGNRSGVTLAVGNMGRIYFERGEYSQALDCFGQALSESRAIGFRLGLVSWLQKMVNLLLMVIELNDQMPDYLAEFLTSANESKPTDPDQWQPTALEVGRRQAEESFAIASDLSLTDAMFSSKILFARIDGAEGKFKEAYTSLMELLQQEEDVETTSNQKERQAELHYWLYRILTLSDTEGDSNQEKVLIHGSEALRIYTTLLEKTPKLDYRQRVKELSASIITSEANDVTD